MSSSQLDEEAIFGVACKIDAPAARAEYLRQVCGDDQVLLDRVATLLRAYTEDGDFLESPVMTGNGTAILSVVSEMPGAVIGPYKLLEQIGSGGMGLVFMAEQQRPMRRLVALKIIKPGMDTRQVIARFEAERQVLAMMDHPNIARIYDAGATGDSPPLSKGGSGGVGLNGDPASESNSGAEPQPSQAGKPDVHYGRAYFVMELVRGIPVTEYCDQARLPTRDRLQLFITVCEAVQHAHQKGIIHRDIKPSNILVTMHDDKAVPKVIDFGVAKATNQRLVEQTLFTNFAQMIGTPTYMSPEQAQMSGLDVDTRSDVYSLGVLLYELLTGSTPFDKKRLREAGYDELRRIIRDEEPPRPSARVTSLDAASHSTIAENRTIDRRKFSQALRGELDWIVMKALEKDRTRRYDSVSALIADVKRYLADEPVEACPPSAGYRLRKFARRRKRLFAFLSLFAGFLVTSIVGLATAYVLISRERTEVLRQSSIAQQHERMVIQRERTIRNYLYAADVQLAWSAYAMGDGKQAREKLLSHLPAPDGADDRGFEWHHLWNLCQNQPRTFLGHERDVYSVAFSQNGRRLASASADRTVAVWNMADGSPERKLTDFSDDVNGLCFSDDGNLLATAEENQMARVWDLRTGGEIARFVGFEWPVARIVLTSDQRTLIATEVDWVRHKGNLSVWDLATQKRRKFIAGTRALAVDANRMLLAAVDDDGTLSTWTLPDLEIKSSWPGHQGQVLCGTFAPDGEFLATACRGGEIGLWKLATSSGRRFSAERGVSIRNLAFSPDGGLLIAVGDEAAALVWDTRSGTLQKVLEGTHGRLWSVDVSREGSSLAIGCGDGTVEIRDLAEITPPRRLIHRSSQSFRGAALDSSGMRLAVIDADQLFVSILDPKTGDVVGRLAEPDAVKITAVAFDVDNRTLWTGNVDGMVSQLDLSTGHLWDRIRLHQGAITELYGSPGGRFLATNGVGADRTSKVWDRESKRVVLTLSDSGDPGLQRLNVVRGFSGESAVITSKHVVASKRTLVALWDLEAGLELPRHFPHESWVTDVAVSPDGQTLATATQEFMAQLWDVAGSQIKVTLRGHRQRFCRFAFSPDGRTLATAGDGGELKLWHLPTAQFLYDRPGHTAPIRYLKFTPDGTRLISAADTATGGSEILVWDGSPVASGESMTAVGTGAPD